MSALSQDQQLKLMIEAVTLVLGVGDVHVEWTRGTAEGAKGAASLTPDYLKAKIAVNLYEHDDRDQDELLDTVLHEYVHVALMPMWVHQCLADTFAPEAAKEAMHSSYTHANEQITVRFTRALFPAAKKRYQELKEKACKPKTKKKP